MVPPRLRTEADGVIGASPITRGRSSSLRRLAFLAYDQHISLLVVKLDLVVSHPPLCLFHTIRYPGDGHALKEMVGLKRKGSVNLFIVSLEMVNDSVLFSTELRRRDHWL